MKGARKEAKGPTRVSSMHRYSRGPCGLDGEERRQWARRVLEVFLDRMQMSLSGRETNLGVLDRLALVRTFRVGEYGTHRSSVSVATMIVFSPSTLKIEVNLVVESPFDLDLLLPPDVVPAAAAATSEEEEEDEDEEEEMEEKEEEEIVDPVDVSEDPLSDCDFIIWDGIFFVLCLIYFLLFSSVFSLNFNGKKCV